LKAGTDNNDESGLLELADAINNGVAIDWDAVEASSALAQRFVVHELKAISRISAAYREVPRTAQAPDGDPGARDSDSPPATWGSLEIIEKIGEGAFGEVFRARDSRLDREVALKLCHPERLSPSRQTAGVIEEGRLLARVHHHNVVAIHGAEQHEGLIGIWMEFIDGSTLAEILSERGTLSPEEAMVIGRDLCRALAALHQSDVVHRDIKPRNVMREEGGRIVLMDFGVSCEIDRQVSVSQYGTPLYAAPEVLLRNESTYQSDIYSVGVLLFHMVTGHYPVSGRTLQEICEAHQAHQVQLLRDLRPDLPRVFIRIVEQALAVDPARRFATAGQLEQALISALGEGSQASDLPTSDLPSIAVLPFKDLSPQKDQDYFCEGLAEELINALAKIKSMKVAARTSAFQFKDKDQDIRQIGAKLNVGNVLEGSVRKSDGRLRIMAQLINVADGFHVWSEQYDRGLKDIFSIQDEISLAIVETLKVELLGAEKAQLVVKHTVDQQAFDLYLQGRYFWNRRYEGGLKKAIEYFQQAIAKDPDYALAYVGIADSLNLLAYYGYMPPRDGFPKAKAAAHKALELDDTLGEAHASLGWIATFFDWDFPGAEKEFQRAISLSPQYATTRQWYALLLAALGRFDEALAEVRLGQKLDPHSLAIYSVEGVVLNFMRRPDEAIENYYQTLEMDPSFLMAHIWLGQAFLQIGRYSESLEHLQKAMKISGGFPFALGVLGETYGISGRKEEALEVIARFEALAEETYVSPLYWSLPYIALGMKDEAFELLEKGMEVRDSFLVWLKAAPDLHRLRGDPRYTELIRRVGL